MLSQLFQLFAFLLLGMFARWKIIVDGSFPGGLSRVVVDFFLPCMLFLSVYDNLSLQTLQEERSAFLWGAASFLVTFPLYTFFARKLAKDPYEVGIFQYTFLVPNYGFFGYVLIEAVYGSQMLFHMVIFTIPHMIYGYRDVYRRICGMEKLSLRTLCNPSVFAILLGNRITRRGKLGAAIGILFGIGFALEFVLIFGITFLATVGFFDVSIHIILWFFILLVAGLDFLLLFFSYRFLSKGLNVD